MLTALIIFIIYLTCAFIFIFPVSVREVKREQGEVDLNDYLAIIFIALVLITIMPFLLLWNLLRKLVGNGK